MQQEKTTTELFYELLQLDSIDFFIESLTDLLEINTINVRVPESISANQINSPGNKLQVEELIFPIGLNTLHAYGTEIIDLGNSLIEQKIRTIDKIIDQLQFLDTLEYKLRLAVQKFDMHNPVSFMQNIAFKLLKNRTDVLCDIKSSGELEFTEHHYNQIHDELSYRTNLLNTLSDFVSSKLNNARYDEMRKYKFNWDSKEAHLELAEIGFAITCMWQFGPQDPQAEINFVKKFLSLFELPGDTVAKDRSTLMIRSNESQLTKDFHKALKTQHKLDLPINTKKK
ncbi:MAG: hypothetical protein JST70_13025 [Bacteroidetes bacterium]|nr:hypothetical protein [Bacteroidota bacterium]